MPDGWRKPSSASLWNSSVAEEPANQRADDAQRDRRHYRQVLAAGHEQPGHESGEGADDEDGEDESEHECAFPSRGRPFRPLW